MLQISNKKAFLSLELIFVVLLISIISYVLIPKNPKLDINIASEKLELYLNTLKLKAMSDNKYEEDNSLWHKKRWTLKFFRCKKSVGGLYYVIYSDENMSGHPGYLESLKDPLSKKYIYSSNNCNENEKYSKYTLLTKQFDIIDVQISCNSTSSLGQISFGVDGKIYTRLSNKQNDHYNYVLDKPCSMKLISSNGLEKEIILHPNTGFIDRL